MSFIVIIMCPLEMWSNPNLKSFNIQSHSLEFQLKSVPRMPKPRISLEIRATNPKYNNILKTNDDYHYYHYHFHYLALLLLSLFIIILWMTIISLEMWSYPSLTRASKCLEFHWQISAANLKAQNFTVNPYRESKI